MTRPPHPIVPIRRWLAVLALLSAAANALLLGAVAIQHAAIASYAREAERDWALVRQIAGRNTEAVRRMRAAVKQEQVKALAVCPKRSR